jgi:hypothetical protein
MASKFNGKTSIDSTGAKVRNGITPGGREYRHKTDKDGTKFTSVTEKGRSFTKFSSSGAISKQRHDSGRKSVAIGKGPMKPTSNPTNATKKKLKLK